MKKLIGLISAAMLALAPLMAPAGAENAKADDGSVRKELTAVEATRLMGNGINLCNTLEACDNTRGAYAEDPKTYEVSWGQPETTREMIRGMKDAGFDTLRIPVAWMTNASGLPFGGRDYTLKEAYLARVREITDWAREAEGMDRIETLEVTFRYGPHP